MTRWHGGIASRFSTFPKYQQLLMAANELNRAQNMQSQLQEYKKALERALELLDLMSGDVRWRPALRELRRGREMVARLYVAPEPQPTRLLLRTLIQLDQIAWKLLNPFNGRKENSKQDQP